MASNRKANMPKAAGMIGQVRSPMNGSMIIGKMRTPDIASNTTIKKTAMVTSGPSNPYVLRSGSRAGRNS